MNVYILRHGLAVERGSPGYARDSERPLTPKGERRTWQAAEAMEAMGISFDVVLTSPFVRARRTAEIVVEAFNIPKRMQFSDDLKPDGSFKQLVQHLNSLRPVPENILLVGHEPHLSGFISLLIAGDSQAITLILKKGGFCKLSAKSLRATRCAVIEWLLTPGQMKRMT